MSWPIAGSSCQHGLVEIQVDLALSGPGGNGGVVTDDLLVDLIDGFSDDGIDFPGHDGTARLVFGLFDLAETVSRTGSEKPQVVRNLVQRPCDGPKCAVGLVIASWAACASKWLSASRKSTSVSALMYSPLSRGSRGGCSVRCRRRFRRVRVRSGDHERPDAGDTLLDLRAVPGEFLHECHRRRVLQVGSSGLDDGVDSSALASSSSRSVVEAGMTSFSTASSAATCIAVGITSFRTARSSRGRSGGSRGRRFPRRRVRRRGWR